MVLLDKYIAMAYVSNNGNSEPKIAYCQMAGLLKCRGRESTLQSGKSVQVYRQRQMASLFLCRSREHIKNEKPS